MILPSIDAISAVNNFVPSVSEVIPVVIESLTSILTSVEQKGKNMTVMTSLRSLRLKSRADTIGSKIKFCSSAQSLWSSTDQTCIVQRLLLSESLTLTNWGFFAILVKIFLFYSLEGVSTVLKAIYRVQRPWLSGGKFLWLLASLLFCSGIAPFAKFFEKQRSRTIFLVSGPFCKPTSDPSISGHWPLFPRSSAPGLLSSLKSEIERLLVE